MNAIEILEGSITRLERGWGQHSLEDSRGNVCALGAVLAVSTGEPDHRLRAAEQSNWVLQEEAGNGKSYMAAWKAVGKCAAARGYGSIVQFNNAPETTQGDVIAAFREAIRDLKAATAEPLPLPLPMPVAQPGPPATVNGTLITRDLATR